MKGLTRGREEGETRGVACEVRKEGEKGKKGKRGRGEGEIRKS